MSGPGILLGILIATFLALVYHFIVGGSLRRMGQHIAAAVVSFFAGHLLSEFIGQQILRFGTLNLLPAILATVIGLITASILLGPEEIKPPRRKSRRWFGRR
ncbi:MAG: hypothetical protein PVF49_06745 [Anaerolineales bacterium]|jgi:hypothetical protein